MNLFEEQMQAMARFHKADMPDKVFLCLQNLYNEDRARTYPLLLEYRREWQTMIKENISPNDYMRLVKQSYILAARDYFEDYLIAVEFDIPYKNKFYLPRRCYLRKHGIIQAYQSVLDGELDYLTISLPKRAGKSQLGINFVTMLSGKFPLRASLMEGTGDDLINSFYKGCLQYIDPLGDYLFGEIFPNSSLVQTLADTHTIDLYQTSRFPTIMCRSIDARQVGLSEATNVLYLDDCVEGREEAKNRQRLDAKWEIINGDVLGRAIEGTPVVVTGTRYSLYDPIGRVQDKAKQLNARWKAIEVPALDPVTEESNYEYYNPKLERKVFTTEYFRNERETLSREQFESEFQQQPFEAKGQLFPEKTLNYFMELPVDRDPDYIYAVCDTAEGGGDSVVMLIAYIFGEDVFIADLVYDDSTPDVTKPQCARKLFEHKVGTAMFESNNAGTYYARDVEQLVKGLGGRCGIIAKRTTSNKQTRIELASDNIKKYFWFLDKSKRAPNSQYSLAMKELYQYTRTGKVPHDDMPDALSLLENALRGYVGSVAKIMRRPF